LTIPKPDYAFDYYPPAFSKDQLAVNSMIDSIAGVTPGILYPFFAIKWESDEGGTLTAAENQAARAGTAMVWARRRLRYLATGNYGKPTESLCFSLTADCNVGIVWIHWHSSDSYNMKRLKCFVIGCPDSAGELAALVAKIIDWGLSTRLEEIKADLNILAKEPLEQLKAKQGKWEG
jgi:hypothetical protein